MIQLSFNFIILTIDLLPCMVEVRDFDIIGIEF